MATLPVVDHVWLAFRDARAFAHVDDDIHRDLSTAARVGDALFTACDETAGVDRLTPEGPDRWGHHAHYALGEMFELPAGPAGEMDIEGLAVDDGWLWIVGSHALKRDKPEPGDDPQTALDRLARIQRDPNRAFLGRVPLVDDEAAPGHLRPAIRSGTRFAQSIKLHEDRSRLKQWLDRDPRLRPFLSIPSKENGFDIEGLAVRGTRVWLGLRGPVLRGHAVVIELDMKVTGQGHLKARQLHGERRFRLHLLPAGGLGVRDLALDGDDLCLLMGPTLSTDGEALVVRWHGATTHDEPGVVPAERLTIEGALPYRAGEDQPEGLCRWPEGGPGAYLVIYDGPSPERLRREERMVRVDVVRLGA